METNGTIKTKFCMSVHYLNNNKCAKLQIEPKFRHNVMAQVLR